MLKLYPSHLINGISVFEDDDPHSPAFYAMPNAPSFRTDAHGNPIMKFIEYLSPIDLPGGSKGGGFLIFDSQFVVPGIASLQAACDQILADRVIPVAGVSTAQSQETQLQGLESATDRANASATGTGLATTRAGAGGASGGSVGLKGADGKPAQAQIALPTFTNGTASLVLLDSGGALVTKVEGAGKPSLLGSMICSFTAELSPEGVAVVKGAMTGSGGVVQIAYDLTFWGVLPEITGHVWFDSMKFASFYQTIDKSTGHWWSGTPDQEKEKLREQFTASEAGGVEFDFTGLQTTDPTALKLKSDLVNWGWQQLATAVAGVSGQSAPPTSATAPASTDGSTSSAPTNPGVTGSNVGADLGSDRADDTGKDHTKRDEQSASTTSFDETYKEKDSIPFETTQQGTLPNPSAAQFTACSQKINANDPFFAQIHSTVQVNADFAKFHISSVDVNCTYAKSNPNTVAGFHFTKPDDVLKFDSDTVNGDMHYNYSFSVNYLDQNQPYQSPVYTTESPVVTIDVGTLGVLFVNLTVSNVDWTAVAAVKVAMKYPDPDPSGAAVSREFMLTKDMRNDALVVIMLCAIDKKYQYQTTYIMMDGTQLVRDWQEDNTQELFFNSPFEPRTYSFIAEADFVNDVDNIFLRMTYTDARNNYTQTTDNEFTATKQTVDWKFSAVAGSAGVLTYAGVVNHKSHTTENIPNTTATGSLITFGPPNQTVVTVTPDVSMLDFTQIKLVQLHLQYADPANNINVQGELVVKQNGSTPPSWTFYAKDVSKTAYTYTASFFTSANPPKRIDVPVASSSDTDLVLLMPSS